jgi:SUMO ligase MMS21 Smc5/6 complex component
MSYFVNHPRQTHDFVSFSLPRVSSDPCRQPLPYSRLCHHSFSESAIRDFLGPNRNLPKKCPASGCTRKICWDDLQPDKSLEKRVKAAGRRMQRQEEDSDGDEVVE